MSQAEERSSELSQKIDSLQASQAAAAKARKAAEARASEAHQHAHSLEERLKALGPLSNGHAEALPLRPRSAEPPAMPGPGTLSCHTPSDDTSIMSVRRARGPSIKAPWGTLDVIIYL